MKTNIRAHKKEFRAIYLLWLLPGLIFFILYRLSFSLPQLVETVYSRKIFIAANQVLSIATGWFGFSFGEFLLYAFILFCIIFIFFMLIKSILSKKNWWKIILKKLFFLISVFSFIYASFIGLWAFNYARKPLGQTLELDTSPASAIELYETSKSLAQKAVLLREDVEVDESGLFVFSKQTAMLQTTELYNIAAKDTGYDFLGGSFGSAKPVLFSEGLSHANISGIYFPFTGEANLNINTPDLLFAASALHEAAHQRGFAREDEANFLAYYVASYSNNADTMYSSTMLALINSMNKLYAEDADLYKEVRNQYSKGMIMDLEHYNEYWGAFEGKASEITEQVNNTYLKSNMQNDGVKSYGRMVDLLIGLWRKGEL